MRKILIALLTILILFLIPVGIAFWCIQRITIKEFTPTVSATFVGVSSSPNGAPLIVKPASSTPDQNISTNPNLDNLDRAIRYLDFFNIKSNLIRHSLFLDNRSLKVQISYSRLDSNQLLSDILESTLVCDGSLIETKESDKTGHLMRANLILDQSSIKNDKQYVEEIIKNCIANSRVAFKNKFGYPIKIELGSITITKDSGIWFIIEPDYASVVVIHLGVFAFWIGFLLLLREGPLKFYWWAVSAKQESCENSKQTKNKKAPNGDGTP